MKREDLKRFYKGIDELFNQTIEVDIKEIYKKFPETNQNTSGWVIAAYQIELLIRYIFKDDNKILDYRKIEELIDQLQFDEIRGPEKGKKYRIIWESMMEYTYMEIYEVLKGEL